MMAKGMAPLDMCRAALEGFEGDWLNDGVEQIINSTQD